jgi:hypothetical protein
MMWNKFIVLELFIPISKPRSFLDFYSNFWNVWKLEGLERSKSWNKNWKIENTRFPVVLLNRKSKIRDPPSGHVLPCFLE